MRTANLKLFCSNPGDLGCKYIWGISMTWMNNSPLPGLLLLMLERAMWQNGNGTHCGDLGAQDSKTIKPPSLCEGHRVPEKGFNFVLCSPSSKVSFCLTGEKVLGLARTSLVTLSITSDNTLLETVVRRWNSRTDASSHLLSWPPTVLIPVKPSVWNIINSVDPTQSLGRGKIARLPFGKKPISKAGTRGSWALSSLLGEKSYAHFKPQPQACQAPWIYSSSSSCLPAWGTT